MMKWITSGALSLVFSLLFFTAQAGGISPTELKMDKIMNTYAIKMKAAFLEKNDQKTMDMIKSASQEAGTQINQMKSEIEQWAKALKGMKGPEKEAFEKRYAEKPYFKTIFTLMLDPAVSQRLQANPALAKALEDGNAAFPNFKSREESNIEEESSEGDQE
ncbi:hypothetical protein [Rufibacter latericius]|uniref:Uncharacterized protein n=1 Tax=Rufibacter latericius TaxID=2487040 RepID=A0A3M9MMM4_9BACT|nr:hypothetical protein [Rufibacter latericius]RNI26784.1 hypothetical protein EFB08_09840 [Rufibacter latericius]